MPVQWVREQFDGRQGTADQGALREYTRRWLVGVDSLAVDVITVTNAPGLPALYQAYVGADGSVDPFNATCRKITGRYEGDFVWEVLADYSNKTEAATQGDPNPLTRLADI